MNVIMPAKKVLRIEQPLQKILELLAQNGGEIEIPLFADEASKLEAQFEQKFWPFHCPWGVPGDELWIAEPYKVVKECKELSGYTITVQYEDDQRRHIPMRTSTAISKATEPASRMPIEYCRCILVIEDVSYNSANGTWLLQVTLKPESGQNGSTDLARVYYSTNQ